MPSLHRNRNRTGRRSRVGWRYSGSLSRLFQKNLQSQRSEFASGNKGGLNWQQLNLEIKHTEKDQFRLRPLRSYRGKSGTLPFNNSS